MKKRNVIYSIWALFSKTQNRQFVGLKRKVNKFLDGPYFPVHLTISDGFIGMEEELIKKMTMSLKKLNTFSIEVDNYGFKNTFFQSLYIKVKKTNELILRKKIIDGIFNITTTNSYAPHISLYYGEENNKKKKEIISKLPKLKK